jgi:hypothetical protein
MATAYPVQPVPAGWELPVLKRKAFAAEFDQLDFKALAEQEELCRLGE